MYIWAEAAVRTAHHLNIRSIVIVNRDLKFCTLIWD